MSSARIRVWSPTTNPRRAAAALTSLVNADPSLELVAECADGSEALSRAIELAPNLMILDVRMPGASGLEVVAALPEDSRPLVVFATAHDDHAVDAFELHAVDYLLKPSTTSGSVRRWNALTHAGTKRGQRQAASASKVCCRTAVRTASSCPARGA